MIELGFDASEDFHDYSIVWTETSIKWVVDGQILHERASWDPTPIPNLEMRFFVNCWPSNSTELAGELRDAELPVSCSIQEMSVRSLQNKCEIAAN